MLICSHTLFFASSQLRAWDAGVELLGNPAGETFVVPSILYPARVSVFQLTQMSNGSQLCHLSSNIAAWVSPDLTVGYRWKLVLP